MNKKISLYDRNNAVFVKIPFKKLYLYPIDFLSMYGNVPPNIIFDETLTIANCNFIKRSRRMYHDGGLCNIHDMCCECFNGLETNIIYRVGAIHIAGVYLENPPPNYERWMNFLHRATLPITPASV